MSKQVTVYYALQSPWTYLGWARLRELVARSGATAHYRPIQIAPVFEASGTLMLAQRPKQRQAYRLMELRRWRDHLGVPLNLHPKHFPVDESLAARMAIAHRQRGGDIAAFSQAMMTAVWAEERDLADRATPPADRPRAGRRRADAAGGGGETGRPSKSTMPTPRRRSIRACSACRPS